MKKLRWVILLVLLALLISTIIHLLQTPYNIFSQIGIDTWGHFISFFCLTWILHGAFKIPLTNTSICMVLYAALSELGQHYLGFRNGEILDFIGDVAGVVLFILLKWGWLMYSQSTYSQLKKKHRV